MYTGINTAEQLFRLANAKDQFKKLTANLQLLSSTIKRRMYEPCKETPFKLYSIRLV